MDQFRSGALKPVYRWPEGVLAGIPSSEYAETTEQVALTVGDPEHASIIDICCIVLATHECIQLSPAKQ